MSSDEAARVDVARQSTMKLYGQHGSASADQNQHRYPDCEQTSLGQQECRRLTVRWTALDADEHHKTLVLLQFSDNLLDFIQLETTPTHSEILDEKSSTEAAR